MSLPSGLNVFPVKTQGKSSCSVVGMLPVLPLLWLLSMLGSLHHLYPFPITLGLACLPYPSQVTASPPKLPQVFP